VSEPGLDRLLLGGLVAGAMLGVVFSSRAGIVVRVTIGSGAFLFLPVLSLKLLPTAWPTIVTVVGAAFIAFCLSRGFTRLLPGDSQ
jgi:hypothetical protein